MLLGIELLMVGNESASLTVSMMVVADLESLNHGSGSHTDLLRHTEKDWWLRGLDQTPPGKRRRLHGRARDSSPVALCG